MILSTFTSVKIHAKINVKPLERESILYMLVHISILGYFISASLVFEQ